MAEQSYQIGGASDPITGYPSGTTTPITGTLWRGGYCTPSPVGFVGDPGSCDPADDTACGACASCLNVGESMGRDLSVCLRDCVQSVSNRGGCTVGNACLLGTGVCFPGCSSNDECRVQRRDTNGNGRIDPYDPSTNPGGDRLVYDASTNARCGTTTSRCHHDGVSGAVAGIACTHDFVCERDGDCVTAWPGGYCTKFGCHVAGNACAGSGSVCQERRIGISMCLDGCTVAGEPIADRLGTSGRGLGCRPGYSCVWDGVSGAGVANNGGCVPGNYNAVAVENVGATCTDDAQCYSPFGAGLCISGGVWSPSNYCTILDCAAPGMPPSVCGTSNQCVTLYGDVTACLENCTSASGCNPGHACVDYDGIAATPRVCFPVCTATADCRSGETCSIPSGSMSGTCV
jgi:hypothetical protein